MPTVPRAGQQRFSSRPNRKYVAVSRLDKRHNSFMQWLPEISGFRDRLREAVRRPPDEVYGALTALSRHRLNALETLQLDRALQQIGSGEGQPTAVRLALLGSSTVDHLIPGIRVAGLRHGLKVHSHLGSYGQFRQDLCGPSAALREFGPQYIVLSLTAREFIAPIALGSTREEAELALQRAVEDLQGLWKRARETFGATVIQQTFLDTSAPLFGSFERRVPASPARLVRRLNELVIEAAANSQVQIFDLALAAERTGLDRWFECKLWLQAKMQIAPHAVPEYGERLVRFVAAQRGLSKKCLVLDLDNTLWGGVIGDDGTKGILLGEGTARGEAHLALQHYARDLKERGIVLAVCSKNDPDIASRAVEEHPEMILRLKDFACFAANWQPKPENLRMIAAKLNLGIDSLVFVDDNPAERAAVREALPMVAVPELPEDAAGYVECIAQAGYFETSAFTSDDRERAQRYTENLIREADRGSAQDLNEFLTGLNMSTAYGTVQEVDVPRVSQLINKTNQFNPTTQRYSLEQVTEFCKDGANTVLQFRLVDRFGDNGLVSAMIMRPADQQPGVLDIDTWVMSCRVFGRELEIEVMNIAVEKARERGAGVLRGKYIPSAKNVVVQDLYERLGFTRIDSGESETTLWQLALDSYRPQPTQIRRTTPS
jgi:FkbH-like protein